ncbi:hypothetical protein BH11PLA1_BH11PLA1_02330 [soil metagenome]
MKRFAFSKVSLLTLFLAGGVAYLAICTDFFLTEVWRREHPLLAPLTVQRVEDGVLTLADGRRFRPAGIVKTESVTVQEFDTALRVACAQGVEIVRDCGDGRAFLRVEPRFYNWCGTRGYEGRPWAHFAGEYDPAPLSEFLVYCGYATTDLSQPDLTARERWRLEGAIRFAEQLKKPLYFVESRNAFELGGDVCQGSDYDELVQLLVSPPPL